MLSDDQITQFQKIWKKRFNENISKEEACEKGIKLINMVQLIYRPMTKEEYEEIQQRKI